MKNFILLIVAAFLFNSCEFIPNGMKGNGKVKEKMYEISDFKGINVGSGFDVYIKKGNEPSVRVLADENLIPHIVVKNEGDLLKITSRKNFWKYKALKVFITYKYLDALDASGGTDVIFENKVKSDDFLIRMSGGSDAKVGVEANSIVVEVSGGADLDLNFKGEKIIFSGSGGSDAELTVKNAEYSGFTLSGGADADVIGSAETCIVNCSGGSDFHGLGFKVRKATVEVSGAGDARMFVSDEIYIKESGAGSVRFEGGAKIIQKVED